MCKIRYINLYKVNQILFIHCLIFGMGEVDVCTLVCAYKRFLYLNEKQEYNYGNQLS